MSISLAISYRFFLKGTASIDHEYRDIFERDESSTDPVSPEREHFNKSWHWLAISRQSLMNMPTFRAVVNKYGERGFMKIRTQDIFDSMRYNIQLLNAEIADEKLRREEAERKRKTNKKP